MPLALALAFDIAADWTLLWCSPLSIIFFIDGLMCHLGRVLWPAVLKPSRCLYRICMTWISYHLSTALVSKTACGWAENLGLPLSTYNQYTTIILRYERTVCCGCPLGLAAMYRSARRYVSRMSKAVIESAAHLAACHHRSTYLGTRELVAVPRSIARFVFGAQRVEGLSTSKAASSRRG